MKRAFLIPLLCMLGHATLWAQIPGPFASHHSSWTTRHQGFYPGNDSYQDFTTSGDTLINGQLYTRIYSRWQNNPTGHFYYGAYRSDNQKVYFVSSGFSDEHLIYDFGWQIGDSLKVYEHDVLGQLDSCSLVVLDVNQVQVMGTSRMKWRVRYTSLGGWFGQSKVLDIYEGWGALSEPFTPGKGAVSVDYGPNLMCAHLQNQLVYENLFVQNCLNYLLNTAQPEENQWEAYWLPSESQLVISPAGISATESYSATLTSMTGQSFFLGDVFPSSKIRFSVPTAASGIYLVSIRDTRQNLVWRQSILIH